MDSGGAKVAGDQAEGAGEAHSSNKEKAPQKEKLVKKSSEAFLSAKPVTLNN